VRDNKKRPAGVQRLPAGLIGFGDHGSGTSPFRAIQCAGPPGSELADEPAFLSFSSQFFCPFPSFFHWARSNGERDGDTCRLAIRLLAIAWAHDTHGYESSDP
jgi:hypothetical protein